LSELGPVISAGAAIASLGFAIYVYASTRKLVSPFERPLLSLLRGRPGKGAGGTVGYALTIKNSGQRPATKIRFRTRAAPEKDLAQVIVLPEWAPAHDYVPGGQMQLMLWPPESFTEVTLMQVDISYTDGLSQKRYDGECYWLVIFPGEEGAVTGMNQDQRDNAEKAWGTCAVQI
jgi:hypothetical protein